MTDGESRLLYRAIPASAKFSTEEKRALKSFAAMLVNRIASDRTFTCLLTNDLELRKLNKLFLGHDYATDVLSFPSLPGNGELGDLAISAERAGVQAVEFGHSRIDEMRILMLHGVLHLIGMDHEGDRGEMARAERKWRAEFGLPSTLIGRAPSASPTVGSNRRRRPNLAAKTGVRQ